jgi:hypothetical protein
MSAAATNEGEVSNRRDAYEAVARQFADQAVKFSEEQQAKLAEALFDAQLALLRAISNEAARLENFDAARNIPRLVAALQGLRGSMGQGQLSVWASTVGRGGWINYAPDEGGEYFDEDED